MEVETRAPQMPARPFSEGPSYSPITPERLATPETQMQHGSANERQSSDHAQSAVQHSAPENVFNSVPGVEDKLHSGGTAQVIQDPNLNPGLTAPLQSTLELGQGDLVGQIAPTSGRNDVFEAANPSMEGLEAFPTLADDTTFVDSAASVQDSEPNRIRAFAKLEFDDGQFYMNTYAIEIGRDKDAAKQAERRIMQERDRRESESKSKSKDGSNPDLERAQKVHDAGVSAAASVISGGIMHVREGEERARKKKKKRSKSVGSSSKGNALQDSVQYSGITDYQALANASLLDQHPAKPVDLTNMMPSPDECPLIPIHPPPNYESGLTGHKGISRKHVRIAYNHERGLFELHVLGRNGCFIDGTHIEYGESMPLASGTEIQIGGVSMRFILPNVPDGETGTDLRSDAISHSAMSFDFEDGRGESHGDEQDSQSPTTENEDDRYRELRLAQKAEAALMDDDDDDDDDDEVMREDSNDMEIDVRKPKPKIMLKLGVGSKTKTKAATEEEAPPKRKVGRPPKNGIMSKREEAELRRKEKEAAKAKAKEKKKKPAEETQAVKIKTETDEQESQLSPVEKKKGKKKKTEETPDNANEVAESIEKETNEQPPEAQVAPAPKPAKKEKPQRPPRSPSPVWNEAELTPEQLAKPSQSYVVLIHEALSSHPEGRMGLPQIYRAIERKYPYYKLRVQTVGWQSSVRHNLSQHPAFVRVERDGKGWQWGIDPNVSIEREKKRRPSPPPMQAPGWNGSGSNTFNRAFPQNVYTGTNGQMPQNPYAMYPNNTAPPPGRGFPPQSPISRPQFPTPQQHTAATATYQSPYGTNKAAVQNGSENTQNGNQPSQAVPQMPAPYLSQVRSPNGTSGQAPQGQAQASQTGQSGGQTSLANAAKPMQAASGMAQPTQRPPSTQKSPAFSPPPSNNPYGIPPHVWGAIERFRAALKQAMSAIPDGEAMVSQAINKCIGLPAPPNQPYKVFAKENSVLAPLKGMLARFQWPAEGMIAFAEGRSSTRPSVTAMGGPPPSPAPSPGNRPGSGQSPANGNYNRPPSTTPVPVASTPASAAVPPPASATPLSTAPTSVAPTPAAPPPLPPQYQAPPQQAAKRQRPSDGADVVTGGASSGDTAAKTEEPPVKKVAQ